MCKKESVICIVWGAERKDYYEGIYKGGRAQINTGKLSNRSGAKEISKDGTKYIYANSQRVAIYEELMENLSGFYTAALKTIRFNSSQVAEQIKRMRIKETLAIENK